MNRVHTIFSSLHLLKKYSVKITVFSGMFCKMFPWNLKSKSYSVNFSGPSVLLQFEAPNLHYC